MGDSQTRLKRAGAAYPPNMGVGLTKFDATRRFMRRALVMVLLLFLPAANAYVAPEPSFAEPSVFLDGEIILERIDGFWTHEDWMDLERRGLEPLRIMSPTHLLAWGDASIEVPGLMHLDAPAALWKDGGDGGTNPHGLVKILLEPRLPVDGFNFVSSELATLGIDIGTEHVPSPLAAAHVVEWPAHLGVEVVLSFDGVLWLEPVLETEARNIQAAALMQHGLTTEHPAWMLGINGEGVVVGVADSGLDADHACFRNATTTGGVGSEGVNGTLLVGTPGDEHRKVMVLNTTIDGGDTQGHADYKHGTHVAGSLACFNVDDARAGLYPSNGSALAHGSTLVFQDIVSDEGWVPPEVDLLLVEAGMNGAVIHSNSWGDDTTAYTARTSDFDAWALAFPWSLAFIAPGNTGSSLLEPANGRNVAAIGASVKSEDGERWSASAIGPTEAGTNGIFALSIGTLIQSASADNLPDSYNDGLRTSSGTSMATPGAAGVAALIQQLVEEGWISGQEERTNTSMSLVVPEWADDSLDNSTLEVGVGFTPSGALLRALLALSTTPLPNAQRNGGNGGDDLQNTYDGWGQLNLSALLDFTSLRTELEQGHASPANDVWIHDSYRLTDSTPQQWLSQRQGGEAPLENLIASPWNGSGASGPFLQTGETWVQRFTPGPNADLNVRMAHIASPEPTAVNDLQLIARLSDGRIAVGGIADNDGSATLFYSDADLDNDSTFPSSDETTHALRLDAASLVGVDWIEIEVRARFVAPGNVSDGVGLDGTRTGFALAVKGVVRDAVDWNDADGDAVPNIEDGCPTQNATGWDQDQDGCLDDADGDQVTDDLDVCPTVNASMYDANSDGCIDDTDGDGVPDNLDGCLTTVVDDAWPIDDTGCRPLDIRPQIDLIFTPANGSMWESEVRVKWSVVDGDNDSFYTGAQIMVLGQQSDAEAYSIAECEYQPGNGTLFECTWNAETSLPIWSIEESLLRIDVFVQSSNESPEARNERIVVQSSNLFQAKYDNEFFDGDEVTNPSEKQGVASQGRAMFWGIGGLLVACLMAYRLGSQNLRPQTQPEVASPFVESVRGTSLDGSTENE